MRRYLWLVPVVGLFLLVGAGLFRARPVTALGQPAPAFSLPTLDDPDVRLGTADLVGRPAVINFWASWCAPCREEAPLLAAAAKENPDISFLGVNFLDGIADARRYETEFKVDYPSVRDANGRVAKQRYSVTGAPETIFLDNRGRVVGVYIGAFTEADLKRLLEDLKTLKPGETLSATGSGNTRKVP